jgi:hypothetical protein
MMEAPGSGSVPQLSPMSPSALPRVSPRYSAASSIPDRGRPLRPSWPTRFRRIAAWTSPFRSPTILRGVAPLAGVSRAPRQARCPNSARRGKRLRWRFSLPQHRPAGCVQILSCCRIDVVGQPVSRGVDPASVDEKLIVRDAIDKIERSVVHCGSFLAKQLGYRIWVAPI